MIVSSSIDIRSLKAAYDFLFFFFNDTATTEIYTLSLHDALPISAGWSVPGTGVRHPRYLPDCPSSRFPGAAPESPSPPPAACAAAASAGWPAGATAAGLLPGG